MSVWELDGRIRAYDWGSTTAIQALLGVQPDGAPAAELWFGAHPDDPSGVPALDQSLDAVIADDPVALLGADTVERFGPQLPFLMKVLAADKALSIQVHPNLDEAREGFAAEEANQIPRNAPERNYRDPNHKPELVCALTPFEGMCGFRPVADILDTVRTLAVAELEFLVGLLQGENPLRTAFIELLQHPDPAGLVAALLAGLPALGEHDPIARGVRLAAQHFSHDIGTVLVLLLRHVELAAGEAMFLDAGTVHCYLRGTAVEIMAASDNVLRCGLTPKHIDVPELLKITTFVPGTDPRVRPSVAGVYGVPVPDFRLQRIDPPGSLDAGVARIVLCVDGRLDVDGVGLMPGHAAFVPAGQECAVAGSGVAYVGSAAP